MKSRTVVAALIAITFSSLANAAELDLALKTIPGTQSSFVQRFTPKGFKKEQVERGTVAFGTLPQMRWSYTGAEPRLFIFDGATSWLYSPAEKQVQLTRLTDAQKRQLPFAFLWSAAAQKQYRTSEKRSGDDVVITLKPLDTAAELRNVELRVARSTHLIRRVDYTDRAGNRTIFEFSGTRKAPAAADSFRFSPPAGVEVIQN